MRSEDAIDGGGGEPFTRAPLLGCQDGLELPEGVLEAIDGAPFTRAPWLGSEDGSECGGPSELPMVDASGGEPFTRAPWMGSQDGLQLPEGVLEGAPFTRAPWMGSEDGSECGGPSELPMVDASGGEPFTRAPWMGSQDGLELPEGVLEGAPFTRAPWMGSEDGSECSGPSELPVADASDGEPFTRAPWMGSQDGLQLPEGVLEAIDGAPFTRAPWMGSEDGSESCGEPSELPVGVVEAIDVMLDSLDDRYELGELLGSGRFSKVFSATRKGSDCHGCVFALKAMELDLLSEDEEALEMLEAECSALRLASEHERLRDCVVRLHEVICTPSCVYLALDRVSGFELFSLVEEHGALPEPLVRVVVAQLLEALDALHAIGIVHRDIKPENLIVSRFGGAEQDVDSSPPRLTLIDFGYACTLRSDELCEGLAGSPEYAAPEVLSWIDPSVRGEAYGGAADLWSAGVTVHVLLCAELPFELPEGDDVSEADLVEAARNVVLDFRTPAWDAPGMRAASALVLACMAPNAAGRPTAREARRFAWLSDDAELHAAEVGEAAAEEGGAGLEDFGVGRAEEALVDGVAAAASAAAAEPHAGGAAPAPLGAARCCTPSDVEGPVDAAAVCAACHAGSSGVRQAPPLQEQNGKATPTSLARDEGFSPRRPPSRDPSRPVSPLAIEGDLSPRSFPASAEGGGAAVETAVAV